MCWTKCAHAFIMTFFLIFDFSAVYKLLNSVYSNISSFMHSYVCKPRTLTFLCIECDSSSHSYEKTASIWEVRSWLWGDPIPHIFSHEQIWQSNYWLGNMKWNEKEIHNKAWLRLHMQWSCLAYFGMLNFVFGRHSGAVGPRFMHFLLRAYCSCKAEKTPVMKDFISSQFYKL